jgi:hypothetical protein
MSKRKENIKRLKNLKFDKKEVVIEVVEEVKIDADVNNDGVVDEEDVKAVEKEAKKKKKKK